MDVMLRLIQLRDPKAAMKRLVRRLKDVELKEDMAVMYGKLRIALDRGKTKQAIEEAGILLSKLQTTSVELVQSILRDLDTAKSLLSRMKDSYQFLTQMTVSTLTIIILLGEVI